MRYWSSTLARSVAAASLVVAAGLFFDFVVSQMLGQYVDSWVAGRSVQFPMTWLPRRRTAGGTVIAYQMLVSVVQFLVVPALVFALGYRYGTARSAESVSE